MVVTQVLPGGEAERSGKGPFPGDRDRARLVLVHTNSSTRLLSEGFYSACDPDVSFDATRLLFAGKKTANDSWNIYEIQVGTGQVRQVTRDNGNCRHPCYQTTLFTLDAPAPWYQVAYVSDRPGVLGAGGSAPLQCLYSRKLDGSDPQRLTYNLSQDQRPCLLPDGMMLFASTLFNPFEPGPSQRIELFNLNIDGTDFSKYARGQKPIQQMPCVTSGGLVVFIESDRPRWDGSGCLASVTLRRPLHSYRPITRENEGTFHSPSPLPDGCVLVSRRSAQGKGTYGVLRLDPSTGKWQPVFHDPQYHTIQARLLYSRPEPDGRSSNVVPEDLHGKLFCLDLYLSDLAGSRQVPAGSVKRLRILEGIPRKPTPILKAEPGAGTAQAESLIQRRLLGEVAVDEDGSFNLEVPANTPVQLQTVDGDGLALRTCTWIWVRNHESRGCIGCHEDGELVPENRFAQALGRPSANLCPPVVRPSFTDFRHDVVPIVLAKCVACHGKDQAPPHLTAGQPEDGRVARILYDQLLQPEKGAPPAKGRYVHPGKARTSPLVWHLFGRNTSWPWDGPAVRGIFKPMAPGGAPALTEKEKQVLVRWIDLGALWERPVLPAQTAKPPPTAPPTVGGEQERGGGL
jgi:cytochrome c553